MTDEKLRERIKKLASAISIDRIELALCLVTVYNQELWLDWGFRSFQRYAEEELEVSTELLCT